MGPTMSSAVMSNQGIYPDVASCFNLKSNTDAEGIDIALVGSATNTRLESEDLYVNTPGNISCEFIQGN
jgi:hypothetical protein